MSQAFEIARFYGQGKEVKNGAGWLTMCAVHGNTKTPALSITDKGDGDVDVFCHGGCNFKEIKDRFRADGLLPEWTPEKKNGTKTKLTSTIKKTDTPPEKPQEKLSDDKESYIWKQATKEGLDNAKKYFATRAITLDPLPVCLKWNSYTDKNTGEVNNMAVFAASMPGDTKVYAVQRLFIDLDDHKKTSAKMHGPCNGRGVWFDRKGDMTEIVIGEGIETVMSVLQATGKNCVSALSTAGMKGIELPGETNTLYICTDSDTARDKETASMPGQKAAYVLAEKFTASREGRKAYIVSPDDTCFTDSPVKLDFNDLLKSDPTGGTIKDRFNVAVEIRDMEWKPSDHTKNTECEFSNEDGIPASTIAALSGMNKKYAAVLLGGDFRVVKEGYDKKAKKHTLSFLKLTSLYSYYQNSKVYVPTGPDGCTELKELAKFWMGWDGRRTYEDVVFDPSMKVSPNVYNLFRGFPLEPSKGNWSLMRKHVKEDICNGNDEHYRYLMAWMARAVQDPGGDKPGVAIVLKGGKGIGKGVFANYFGSIFGEAFLPIADSESFTGKFNMHLSKSLVVFLDEAVWGGDKRAEGKLKQLITEPTILFEPKGIDSMALGNFINVIIASNEDWVIPATGDERRFFVLQPSDRHRKDTVYFGKIVDEQNSGGAEAMMYDLMHYDFKSVDLRKAPITDGLIEQVQESLPNVWEFWLSVLDREFILSDRETGRPKKTELINDSTADDLWPGEVCKHEIHAEYRQWCSGKNERYPKSENQFWIATWKIWPGGTPKRYRKRAKNNDYLEAILLPPVKEAKETFTYATKIKFDGGSGDKKGADAPIPFNEQF